MKRGPKPQGLNGERRSKPIPVRFSPTELAVLRRAAGGGSVADLVRDGALGLAFRILNEPAISRAALPKGYEERKAIPLFDFLVAHRRAIRELTRVAVAGNEQHNPGEPLHWAREKSTDQLNTAMRHLFDHATGNLYDSEPEKVHAAIDAEVLPVLTFLTQYFPAAILRVAQSSSARFTLDFAFDQLDQYAIAKEVAVLTNAAVAVFFQLQISAEINVPRGHTMHLAKACWRLLAELQLALERGPSD